MVAYFYCKVLPLFNLISYVITVPPDYCLQPLNKHDCGKKPVAVVSYYKEGSRCEIETWRGCPTVNKFPDEVSCSQHCIFNLGGTDDVPQKMPLKSFETDLAEMNEFKDSGCQVAMNKSDCGIKDTYKYTYIGKMCVKVEWHGCESQNMFDDEQSCSIACDPNNEVANSISKILLSGQDTLKFSQMLDNVEKLTDTTVAPVSIENNEKVIENGTTTDKPSSGEEYSSSTTSEGDNNSEADNLTLIENDTEITTNLASTDKNEITTNLASTDKNEITTNLASTDKNEITTNLASTDKNAENEEITTENNLETIQREAEEIGTI